MTTLNQTVPSYILYTLIALPFGLSTTVSAATKPVEQTENNIPKAETSNQENFLDYIPKWVDASPTVLPEQSDQSIVPPTAETENKTWVDRKQRDIRNW